MIFVRYFKNLLKKIIPSLCMRKRAKWIDLPTSKDALLEYGNSVPSFDIIGILLVEPSAFLKSSDLVKLGANDSFHFPLKYTALRITIIVSFERGDFSKCGIIFLVFSATQLFIFFMVLPGFLKFSISTLALYNLPRLLNLGLSSNRFDTAKKLLLSMLNSGESFE